ncbi:MAG: serine/threonine protein kinase [Polyangiaceae bacterium]|nr:serine/threonine protein kinase [Polyangiaceae bacterium]
MNQRGAAPSIANSARIEPGDILGGRYEIVAELGRGAEGVVLEARDLRAVARVALKLIPEDDVGAARLARLRRELALARRITHERVVRTYDLVDIPGWVGLTMECIDGRTLGAALSDEPRPVGESRLREIAVAIAEGLAAAHGAGVVHRDLKPSNILFAHGGRGIAISDFGVARMAETGPESTRTVGTDAARERLTSTGQIVGTPLYMAPEQLQGSASVGPAADVYAFGLVMSELATGEVPLASRTIDELRARRREPPRRLLSLRPDLSTAFAGVIDRCLEPDPTRRIADGRTLLRALTARPASFRRRAVIATGCVVAAISIAGAVAFARRFTDEEPVASVAAGAEGEGTEGSIRFVKRDPEVGRQTRIRQTMSMVMTYSSPIASERKTVERSDQTTTILAADGKTILKVKIVYGEATRTLTRDGEVTTASEPVQGRTYIAELKKDRLVVTDDSYRPVSKEEQAIVEKGARLLGEPHAQLTAIPDRPLRPGDRADTIGELLRGLMAADGGGALDDAKVILRSIEGDDPPIGVFDVDLKTGRDGDEFTIEAGLKGTLRIRGDDARFDAVELAGPISLSGSGARAEGAIELSLDYEDVP